MRVDLVIATYNRADQLRETLLNVRQWAEGINRIYIVDNNSSDHTQEVLREFTDSSTVVIRNGENLGAAGGKNVGLRRSDADIVVVIDDDAEFCSENPIGRVRDLFRQNERLGIVQFKIINFQTKRVLKYEFPGGDPERYCDTALDIGYFIGAGHAIRRSLLEQVGYYPDDFGLYAHEEVDLSYRAVNAGYVMRYAPSVAVYHKKDPGGRLPADRVLYQLLRNRFVMTRRYLPFPYSMISNFLWFCKTALSARSLTLPSSAYLEYLKLKPAIRREVLSASAVAYMRRNGGRLFR